MFLSVFTGVWCSSELGRQDDVPNIGTLMRSFAALFINLSVQWYYGNRNSIIAERNHIEFKTRIQRQTANVRFLFTFTENNKKVYKNNAKPVQNKFRVYG